MEENFSILVNYLWKETMKKLNTIMTEEEVSKFSSNDYYYLCTINELKNPNFTMIADELNITKPAVSVMIRKLISMGLVEKEKSVEDRRVSYVRLTEKGKQIIKGDDELYNNLSNEIKSIVKNEEELKVIQNIMKSLAAKIVKKQM